MPRFALLLLVPLCELYGVATGDGIERLYCGIEIALVLRRLPDAPCGMSSVFRSSEISRVIRVGR